MSFSVLSRLIALIDQQTNEQLNAIIHSSKFQALESRWRGLLMLLNAKESDRMVEIRLLNCSLTELNQDVMSALEFDHTALFKLLYSDEYDRPGGRPYGLLVGDYEFSHLAQGTSLRSTEILTRLSLIASMAHLPMVFAASASLLGINNFCELKWPFHLKELFSSIEYVHWKNMQRLDSTRYIGLVMPRILMRQPIESYFEEKIRRHEDYLWGNPAFAFGVSAIHAFRETGWFVEMRGSRFGEQIKLPRVHFDTRLGQHFLPKCSVDYQFTASMVEELSDYGFIPLTDHPWVNQATFYHLRSLYKNRDKMTNQDYFSSMFHYLLSLSRFAHYIKIMMRDKIGSSIEASDCERYLSNWIRRYCATGKMLTQESKIRHPLNDAKVQVIEKRGKPGNYYCEVDLKPHDQLDQFHAYLRLTTHLS